MLGHCPQFSTFGNVMISRCKFQIRVEYPADWFAILVFIFFSRLLHRAYRLGHINIRITAVNVSGLDVLFLANFDFLSGMRASMLPLFLHNSE